MQLGLFRLVTWPLLHRNLASFALQLGQSRSQNRPEKAAKEPLFRFRPPFLAVLWGQAGAQKHPNGGFGALECKFQSTFFYGHFWPFQPGVCNPPPAALPTSAGRSANLRRLLCQPPPAALPTSAGRSANLRRLLCPTSTAAQPNCRRQRHTRGAKTCKKAEVLWFFQLDKPIFLKFRKKSRKNGRL